MSGGWIPDRAFHQRRLLGPVCMEIEEGNSLVMNLVPCTLLADIPGTAAWDGETHNAGENGLWDKVGKKFYGNTLATGAFTVID